MKRTLFLGTVFTTVMVLVLPFVGGGGPSFLSPAVASATLVAPGSSAHGMTAPVAVSIPVTTSVDAIAASTEVVAQRVAAEEEAAAETASTQSTTSADVEHVAQKPVPKPQPPVTAAGRASGTLERRAALEAQGASCPGPVGGSTAGAPGRVSGGGVGGTTSADLNSFAAAYNSIRVANCLTPVPMANIRYDACMEDRLFWIAEDPSPDVTSAWGHKPQVRSDGVPDTGCDGNLAGGSGNTGATVAQKWWDSSSHRASLYRPTYTGGTGGVCIYFAMVHGGLPSDGYNFTRAAARWGGC